MEGTSYFSISGDSTLCTSNWETQTMQRCLTRMLFRCLLLSRSLLVMFDCGYGVRLDGTYTVKLVLRLYRDRTLPNHVNNFHQFPECVAEP